MDEHPVEYSRSIARAAGFGRRQVRADGVRLGRGVHLSRAAEPDLAQLCRAWSLIAPPGSAFGRHTAAALLGAPVAAPTRPQLVVPTGVVPPRHRGLQAVSRDLTPRDVVVHDGIRLTSGAQTWLDLARELPDGELVAIGDALLRAGHLDDAQLAERLGRAAGLRGMVRARARAGQLDARAASRPESIIRVALLDSPLPDPELQVPVHDRSGRVVAHADFGWRRYRVLGEYEGAGHREAGQFGRDVERYTQMAADDHLVLRFSSVHLGRLWAVVDRCERALRSRGWTPPPPNRR